MPKIQKQKTNAAQRAWNLLRLVLKYRRRLMMDLRLFSKFLKTLGHSNNRGSLPYGEHELSFDKTPIVHIKMHRPSSVRFKMPKIPCINPQNEFDYDYEWNNESDVISYCNEEETRRSFLMSCEEDRIECGVDGGDEGIDLKAEEFIANFYKQLKMQRQVSYLQYNEMLNRGSN